MAKIGGVVAPADFETEQSPGKVFGQPPARGGETGKFIAGENKYDRPPKSPVKIINVGEPIKKEPLPVPQAQYDAEKAMDEKVGRQR